MDGKALLEWCRTLVLPLWRGQPEITELVLQGLTGDESVLKLLGAARYTSDYKCHLPSYPRVIELARLAILREGMDPEELMHGLL